MPQVHRRPLYERLSGHTNSVRLEPRAKWVQGMLMQQKATISGAQDAGSEIPAPRLTAVHSETLESQRHNLFISLLT